MTSDGRRRDDLLEQALDMDAPSRNAFLDEMCGADTDLRAAIERLLALDRENGGDFLDPEPDPADADLPRGTEVDRYVIDEKIGAGGMGAVYRAYDPRLVRHVALKLLKPLRTSRSMQQRFMDEARALGGLHHDGIVRVYDAGEYDGHPFLVTELLEGEDLARAIEAGRVGDRARQLAILTAVAEALGAVHAAGFVHRDVKPSNVFLTREGGVKLLDFGIARPMRRTLGGMTAVVGTPRYMSPEQMLGQPATSASDVYGFGMLAFEVLTGKPLARDKVAELETTSRPLADVVPSERLSPPLVELLRRSTLKDRTERIQTFAEVLSLLRAALELAVTRGWWTYPVAALAIVGVLAALALFARHLTTPRQAEVPAVQAATQASQTTAKNVEAEAPPAEVAAAPGSILSMALVVDQDGERRVQLTGTPLVLRQSQRFGLVLSSGTDGHLYVFTRSRNGNDLYVLFPSPTSYAGSSRLETSRALRVPELTWLQFGKTPGVERLWLVWSRHPQMQFEDAARQWANDRHRGLIGDNGASRQIVDTLERDERPLVPEAGRLRADAESEMLVGVVEINHQ